MKKMIMFLLLLSVALSGCSKTKSSPTSESTTGAASVISEASEASDDLALLDAIDPAVKEYVMEHRSEYEKIIPLHCGGVLVAKNDIVTDLVTHENYTHFVLEFIYAKGKDIMSGPTHDGNPSKETKIFYDEDWENIEALYGSSFERKATNTGEDFLVYVVPNRYQKQDSPDWEDWEESSYYNEIPWDTLDTLPTLLYDESGWPIWIFDIPAASVNTEYELHFADFVLTGTDLAEGKWTIGNAPVLW